MDNDKPNRPDDDYRAASQATAEDDYDDYTNKPAAKLPPVKRTSKKKPILIILVVLIVVAGLGLAAWLLFLKDKPETTGKETDGTTQPSTQVEEKAVIASETEHYASSNFMLEFDYPADWKVVEAEDGSRLTATSPALQLESGSSQTITGQAVLTIRNKQQAMPEFDKGNAVAVLESAKINYAKPSSVQRGSTYLSFLQYASSATTSLDGAYITGDVGYQKGQAIPKADFTPVDPIISVTFVKCADSACTGDGTAAGVNTSMWQDDSFGKPLQAMLQSLVVN
jgi:hypothetical protein